jgi:hypothetical protein
MRARILLVVAVGFAVAACSAGATLSPSPATSPAATPQISLAPSAAPSPSVAFLTAKVTFDGKNCRYVGPTSVPDGTALRFEHRTAVESALVVGGVDKTVPADLIGTTLEHASTVPAWFDTLHYNLVTGTGTIEFTATNAAKKVVTNEIVAQPLTTDVGVFVGCSTPPDEDDLMYPGAIIWIVPD